jgi:hypothetical protein
MRKKFPLWVLVVLGFSCDCFLLPCFGSEDNVFPADRALHAEERETADFSSVDSMVKAIYASVTFRQGERPDMDRFRSLFATDAHLIRITKEGLNKWTPEGFITFFLERINTGTVRSFHESELSRKTNAVGSIAQVFSTYQKGINTNDPASLIRGMNSIQLYCDGLRWWISCLVWEDLPE